MTHAEIPYDKLQDALLDAALLHVPFDGWSDLTFKAAVQDIGVEQAVARSVCPRGSLDLAIAYHKRGDDAMVARMAEEDMSDLRFRDKIATAVRFRIEAIADKEVVRRGSSLFALPQNAAEGAKLIWGTADRIWTTLGDSSDDVNWYTKRATLSGVYGATVLYWLGDESYDHEPTWAFLDRRIENVMQIEKVKGTVNNSFVLKGIFAGPRWFLSQIHAPSKGNKSDLPGRWTYPK